MGDSPLNRLERQVRERMDKEKKKIAELDVKRDVEKAHSQYLRRTVLGRAPHPQSTITHRRTAQAGSSILSRTNACMLLGCGRTYTSEARLQQHMQAGAGREVWKHSPCDPLRHLPDGVLECTLQTCVCPMCGDLYRNREACYEHMRARDHHLLHGPLAIVGYLCPECLHVFPDQTACHAHMHQRRHSYVRYPLQDDSAAVPVPLPRRTYKLYTRACREVTVTRTDDNRVTAESRCGEVFGLLLKSHTCIQCLRLFDGVPAADADTQTHRCHDAVWGMYIDNDCKTFAEFVRRLGLKPAYLSEQESDMRDSVLPVRDEPTQTPPSTRIEAASGRNHQPEHDPSSEDEQSVDERMTLGEALAKRRRKHTATQSTQKRSKHTPETSAANINDQVIYSRKQLINIGLADIQKDLYCENDLNRNSEEVQLVKSIDHCSKTGDTNLSKSDQACVSESSKMDRNKPGVYIDDNNGDIIEVLDSSPNINVNNNNLGEGNVNNNGAKKKSKSARKGGCRTRFSMRLLTIESESSDSDGIEIVHCSTPRRKPSVISIYTDSEYDLDQSVLALINTDQSEDRLPSISENALSSKKTDSEETVFIYGGTTSSSGGRSKEAGLYWEECKDTFWDKPGTSQVTSSYLSPQRTSLVHKSSCSLSPKRTGFCDAAGPSNAASVDASPSNVASVEVSPAMSTRSASKRKLGDSCRNAQEDASLKRRRVDFSAGRSTDPADRSDKALVNMWSPTDLGLPKGAPFFWKTSPEKRECSSTPAVFQPLGSSQGPRTKSAKKREQKMRRKMRQLAAYRLSLQQGSEVMAGSSATQYSEVPPSRRIDGESSPGPSAGVALSSVIPQSPDTTPDNLSLMSHIVFLDLDNWLSFFQRLPLCLPEHTFVWAFYGGATVWKQPQCESFRALQNANCFYLHNKCGRRKDAADFAICLWLGRMDERLPKHIPFTILSGDHGFHEVEAQMADLQRRTVVINPHHQSPEDVYGMIISVAQT